MKNDYQHTNNNQSTIKNNLDIRFLLFFD